MDLSLLFIMPKSKYDYPRTRLILIRHGETAWNRARRYQGRSDIPLAPRGRRQARQMRRFIKNISLDAVYASTLSRAIETAQLVTGRRPRQDKRLDEIDFGAWEGQNVHALLRNKDKAFLKWSAGIPVVPPGGESLSAVERRVRSFLQTVIKKHPGKTIAVISHSGTLRAVFCALMGLPKKSFWAFRIDPASLAVFDVYGRFAQCLVLNQRPDRQCSL